MKRREWLVATVSAAAVAGASRVLVSQQAVAKPSATGVDESKVKAAREVQRSTIVVTADGVFINGAPTAVGVAR